MRLWSTGGEGWGRYDPVMAEGRSADDLVESEYSSGIDAFLSANERIIDEALSMAGDPARVLPVVVWEGAPRGDDDVTAAFAARSLKRGIRVYSISTLNQDAANLE